MIKNLIYYFIFLLPFLVNAQNPIEFVKFYCTYYQGTEAIGYCLQGLYNLGVALAVVLAFFMFLFGAFKNLLSTLPDVKADGKNMMKNAILGLVVIFISGTLLYWINPFIFEPVISIYRISEIKIEDIKENWTDDDVKNYGLRNPSGGVARKGKIVKVPTYSHIIPTNNDTYKGQKGEFVDESLLPILEKINNDLKRAGVKVYLTDGYSVGDHSSKAHTVYGTAIDIVPIGERKEIWETVCSIFKKANTKLILYEAGPWPSLNCGGGKINVMRFSHTTGKHLHIEF
jgi:hypothetical protein